MAVQEYVLKDIERTKAVKSLVFPLVFHNWKRFVFLCNI
jgi:hypothetical protein